MNEITPIFDKNQIMKETPNIFIKKRPARGGQVNYIEIGYTIAHLNKTFGYNWDFEIVDEKQVDGQIVVKGKLIVRDIKNNAVIKMQYGSSEIKKTGGKIIDLADDYKAAASDCLKKCASLVGIGFDIYYPNVWNVIKAAKLKSEKKLDEKPPEVEVSSHAKKMRDGIDTSKKIV